MALTKEKVTIKTLKRQIESGLEMSESGRSFLPESYLSAIFTSDVINQVVEELTCPVVEKIGLDKSIRCDGARTFAALIKNGEEDLITKFRKHGVLDARLPLSESEAVTVAGAFGTLFAREYQWQFLPYHFQSNMRDYHKHITDREIILPFVGQLQFLAKGGFADVFKACIFASQQDLLPISDHGRSKHVEVVIKKIRVQEEQSTEEYEESTRNELHCLLLLERLEHPNIIRLLASYTYREEHYFLFPFYEQNLKSFLAGDCRIDKPQQAYVFCSSLRGLASALCSTHKLHLEREKHGLDIDAIGYHHDIRPVNILVRQYTFILADFGLGKFKSEESQSQTQWKMGEGDYLAPECMNDRFIHQTVGRAIDVWAFGCLITEIAVYSISGASGVEEFRKIRSTSDRHKNWKDSCFYDGDGELKSIVTQKLESLTQTELHSPSLSLLIETSRKALKKNPKNRANMKTICECLSFASLKAVFLTVCEQFHECVAATAITESSSTITMKLWFEKERLIAFGRVLELHTAASSSLDVLDQNYDDYFKLLKNLSEVVPRCVSESSKSDSVAERSRPKEITKSCETRDKSIEISVGELVESLWDLLPLKMQKRAEASWIRAMLDTDMAGLQQVEQARESGNGLIHEKGAAMAMMKRLRLAMDSNPTGMPEHLLVSPSDVQVLNNVGGHDFGLYKNSTRVLIEWTNYNLGWEKVPPEQRVSMMSLQAQGFSMKTRPASIRTLECVGWFEQTNSKAGYGFLYRVPTCERPETTAQTDSDSTTATLLQYLQNQKIQPLLGQKFRLAHKLAQFLADFHSVGWLHKSLNSNNVLFFNMGPDEQRSGSSKILAAQKLEQPYIVGLPGCRLGGKNWETAGPANGAYFRSYQHPEYTNTRRYRASFDYYSLGLVLFEIGSWKPLQSLLEIQKYREMDPSEFKENLKKSLVLWLGVTMGAVYQNVVQFCLGGISTNSNEDIDVQNLEEFVKRVVNPLEELAELSI